MDLLLPGPRNSFFLSDHISAYMVTFRTIDIIFILMDIELSCAIAIKVMHRGQEV